MSEVNNIEKIALLKAQISDLKSELAGLKHSDKPEFFPETLPFWQFADNIPDIVLIHDMDGTIRFINKMGVKALGFTDINEMLGLNLLDMTPSEHLEKTIERKNRRERGDKSPRNYVFTILTKNKKRLPVEAHSSIINFRNREYVFVIIHDITDLLNNQAVIAAHEIMFRNLFEHSPVAKINYDVNGIILHCNFAFEAFINVKADDIIGKTLDVVFEQPDLLKTLTDATRKESIENLETFEFSTQNKWIKLFLRRIKNEQNVIISVIALLDDITEQKNIEKERLYIQARLERAENIASIGNWELDLTDNRVNTSDGAKRIYGLSKSEMTISDIQELPLAQDRNYLDSALASLIKEGNSYNVSFKIKRLNDNQLRDIQSIAKYDVATNKVFGVIRDITTEKRQQQELEESEARFRTLFYENTSVMMLIDPDNGEIVDVNNAATEFYGYSTKELCSMKIQNINILTPEEVALEIEKAKSGKKNQFQFKHKKRNGEIKNVEVYSGSVKLRSRVLLYSTIHDVTARFKALKDLKENEERLRLALAASKQGLWDINLINKTTNISPEYPHMLGYKPKEFESDKYWEKNLHPDDFEATTKRFWGYINGEYDDYKMRFRLRTKSGNYKWILSRGKIIQWDKNNKPLRMIGIHMDISKMKKVENELLEAKEKAESSNRLKTAFLQNMSHEIRTPMNGIMGFSELLKEDDIDENERNEYIDIVHKNSQQLLHVVNDILDISRLDAGEIKIQRQNVDLLSLIEAEKRFFDKQANDRGLYLKTAIEGVSNQGIIVSDSIRIKQIIDNLISNAIKFTKHGGVTIGLAENTDYIIISVIDTGLGIPEDSHEIIFKRFGQIHTHLVEGGTGLGLPISKKLAHMLGGELTVKSKTNKGSTFKLSLPKSGL
ncbi:MAG: PAS domain S-box protein [Bacteroidales bacterium]|nr:PAS domain S-box protein [Bacteroidales bacterium]